MVHLVGCLADAGIRVPDRLEQDGEMSPDDAANAVLQDVAHEQPGAVRDCAERQSP